MTRRSAAVRGLCLLVAVAIDAAQAEAQDGLAGTYCLHSVREVGSCVRLNADQSFEYFLSYGAYDEGSEGRWRIDGGDVVLDSPAYDRAPRFSFQERRAAGGDRIEVIAVGANGQGIAGVDVRVTCDGRVHEGYTQTYGFATPCTRSPDAIALGVRMVGLDISPVAKPPEGEGLALVFAFDPGDLGRKAFTGARLKREGGELRMTYRSQAVRDLDGRDFRYRRQ